MVVIFIRCDRRHRSLHDTRVQDQSTSADRSNIIIIIITSNERNTPL